LTLNGQSWSISAEWAVYLMFPLFIAAYRKAGARALIGLAIAAVAALELASGFGLENARPWLEWTYDFGALRAVPSFLIGMWLSTCADRGASAEGPGIKTGFALFALSIPLAYLAAALYFTACGELRQQRSWLADVRLVRFGDASYAIYMLHMITLPLGASALRPLLHDSWATTPVIMAATIVAGVLSYAMFERPAQKWILALRAPQGEHPALRRFAQLRLARVDALGWASQIGDGLGEAQETDGGMGKAAVAAVKHAA